MDMIVDSFCLLQLTVSYSCHHAPSFFRFHKENIVVVDVYIYHLYYITNEYLHQKGFVVELVKRALAWLLNCGLEYFTGKIT